MKTVVKINALIMILSMFGMTIFGIIAKNEFKNSLNYELKISEFDPQDFNDVTISADNRHILLGESSNDKINLSFYISTIDTYTLGETNESISLAIKTPWYQSILSATTLVNSAFNKEYSYIRLDVPLNSLASYKIVTLNGNIGITDVSASTLSAKTSNGNINVKNAKVESLSLEVNHGNVDVSVINATLLSLTNTDGNIKGTELTNSTLNAKTNNGNITLNDVVSNYLDTVTANGNIALVVTGVFSEYKVTVKTNNGTIKVDDQKYGSGTYNTDQAKTIAAITSNGTIRLNFIL